jgi:exopolyphosphatase / guanosine-5'-triphosphate,3'-diphosphate pyrophosphatase
VAQDKRPEKGERPQPSPRGPKPPGRYGHIYAALDLGTNNCRLLIARADASGFRVLDAFSRTVRLGEGLAKTGELSAPAIERAIDAIQICAQKMKRRGVTKHRAIATEACRTARNGPAFIERVAAETGITFDIIPPVEEARLAARSVAPLLDRSHKAALVFDIGGGSTELIWLDLSKPEPDIMGWASLPLGVVTLGEAAHLTPDHPGNYQQMVDEVRQRLQTVMIAAQSRGAPPAPKDYHLLGTSGTVTTIAGVHLGLEKYDRTKVDGIWLGIDDVMKIIRELTVMTREERAAHASVGPERAELVVPGLAILEAVLSLWPAEKLRVADRGLREGMLISLMESADREAKQHKRRMRRRGNRRSGRKKSRP